MASACSKEVVILTPLTSTRTMEWSNLEKWCDFLRRKAQILPNRRKNSAGADIVLMKDVPMNAIIISSESREKTDHGIDSRCIPVYNAYMEWGQKNE